MKTKKSTKSGTRRCHRGCAGRTYCAVKHAALCKSWHAAKKTARVEKAKKERARRAAKKAGA